MPDCAVEDATEVFRNAGRLRMNFFRMSPQRARVLDAKHFARQPGGMRVAGNLEAHRHLRPTHDEALGALHETDAAAGARRIRVMRERHGESVFPADEAGVHIAVEIVAEAGRPYL